jgi:hypothetical protein
MNITTTQAKALATQACVAIAEAKNKYITAEFKKTVSAEMEEWTSLKNEKELIEKRIDAIEKLIRKKFPHVSTWGKPAPEHYSTHPDSLKSQIQEMTNKFIVDGINSDEIKPSEFIKKAVEEAMNSFRKK